MIRLTLVGLSLALICPHQPLAADDWPQWLGLHRDGVWTESGIVDHFPANGLTPKWSVPIAGGYAGPAVVGNRVFVHDYVRTGGDPTATPAKASQLEGQERVRCYDADTGDLVWSHEYDCPYEISYPAGPRVTPTVDGDLVYTLGAEGHLLCLRAADGSVVWAHDLKKKYGMSRAPFWGFCGHPLVYHDTLICLVGGPGSVAVAFDKRTGDEIWKALTAKEPGYCPPTLITHDGHEQLIIWHAESVNSLDPVTGKVHWSVPMKPDYGMSIVAPIYSAGYLYVGGHTNKSLLLKLLSNPLDAEEVWRDRGFGPVHSTAFIDQGFLYGIARGGQLRCVALASGDVQWESLEPTTGDRPANCATAFLVRQDDHVFLFNEKGDLILARLSPQGYQEISRVHLLEPTGDGFGRKVLWSHPAFAPLRVRAQ